MADKKFLNFKRKKSNIAFVKTLCVVSFIIACIGFCYSIYFNIEDVYMWAIILLLDGICVFCPDEIKK